MSTAPFSMVAATRCALAALGATILLTGSLAVAPTAPASTGTTPAAAASVPLSSAPTTIGVAARAKRDPRRTRDLFVDPSTKAAAAGKAFAPIARKAQPRWITDYYGTPEAARDAAAGFVAQATSARQTPVLVVYNIPDRDCGLYSSPDDQISDDDYRAWIGGLARGLRGSEALVILEPDAIAYIDDPRCTGRGDRLGLLRHATKKLTRAGAWVYLDAGHSDWRSPDHMAPLLKKAGVAIARGIATNVANVRPTGAEKKYATAVLRELRKRKVSGVKYVIDTGRNGGASATAGDFCNPLEARLGRAPDLVFDKALDGYLWVKPPGESDGYCNGGPGAGEWYPDGACRLLGEQSYDDATQRCRR